MVQRTQKPQDVVAFIADLAARVRRLENTDTVTVGAWVIRDGGDNLTVTHTTSGNTFTLAAGP